MSPHTEYAAPSTAAPAPPPRPLETPHPPMLPSPPTGGHDASPWPDETYRGWSGL